MVTARRLLLGNGPSANMMLTCDGAVFEGVSARDNSQRRICKDGEEL